jgi:hypothetical protein
MPGGLPPVSGLQPAGGKLALFRMDGFRGSLLCSNIKLPSLQLALFAEPPISAIRLLPDLRPLADWLCLQDYPHSPFQARPSFRTLQSEIRNPEASRHWVCSAPQPEMSFPRKRESRACPRESGGTHRSFRSHGVCPGAEQIGFVCRTIAPRFTPQSPIRNPPIGFVSHEPRMARSKALNPHTIGMICVFRCPRSLRERDVASLWSRDPASPSTVLQVLAGPYESALRPPRPHS